MALWLDKHRPKKLSKLDFHKKQAEHLEKLVKSGDFPHLLVTWILLNTNTIFYKNITNLTFSYGLFQVHGPPGAGKKTRIMALLREMYGNGVDRLRIEHQTYETPSKKKIDIATIASNYHIEVNPSDVGIYDRIVIQELIKTTASAQQITTTTNDKEFKVVVITDVDQLSKDAQHALRRTMEKYMTTCRIILCANSTSKVLFNRKQS